jgi:hypothetical protein
MNTAGILLLARATALARKLAQDYRDGYIGRDELYKELAEMIAEGWLHKDPTIMYSLRSIKSTLEEVMDHVDAERDPEQGFRQLLIDIFKRDGEALFDENIPRPVRAYYANMFQQSNPSGLH